MLYIVCMFIVVVTCIVYKESVVINICDHGRTSIRFEFDGRSSTQ